ncbi:MAG: secondary thiamine-phosphate synthase enzyme YjbQ [Spirochaetales bacterium]|nr:secondary thiamine-phosphate synthase enzyme YjbQ [Spirochaetales bacterium]MCF7939803.1 secondary thiamine-phosphate synthase enzyme YjbQ [Spirochaetales bacterium]
MQEILHIATGSREGLYDITSPVHEIAGAAGIENGICSLYVRGATAALMIQENWDDSVQRDVVSLLQKVIPRGVWEHDRQDGNGDAHLKAGLVGPSETVPIIGGRLALSTWQNIFLCEFDGPRRQREVVVSIIPA